MSGKKSEMKPRVHQVTIEKNPKGELVNIGGAKFDAWNKLILNATANAVCPNGDRPEDLALQLDAIASGLLSIRPADPVEGIIIAQLIAAHQASMKMYQLAWAQHKPEYFEGRTRYLTLADKAARTTMMLTERLDHHRGRGQQRIVVQHVNSTTNNVTTNQAVVTETVVTGNAALLTAVTDKPMPMIGGTIEPLPAGVGGGVKSK